MKTKKCLFCEGVIYIDDLIDTMGRPRGHFSGFCDKCKKLSRHIVFTKNGPALTKSGQDLKRKLKI